MDSVKDEIIWLKLKKEFFKLDRDIFIICFVYVPPSSSSFPTTSEFDIFEKIEEDIYKFSQIGNIIIAGDINAKAATESDFVSDNLDEHSPVTGITGYQSDDPLMRRNRDGRPLDAQGSRFLELCKTCRLRIINGRAKGGPVGNFTRWPMYLRESPSTLDSYLFGIVSI